MLDQYRTVTYNYRQKQENRATKQERQMKYAIYTIVILGLVYLPGILEVLP